VAGAEEDQFTTEVRSWVLPSTNVPVAVNWVDVWAAICGVAGVTASVICFGDATTIVAVPDRPPNAAVIVDCPMPWPVVAAEDADATVATVFVLDVHFAILVMS
jgi:hypothetical protein